MKIDYPLDSVFDVMWLFLVGISKVSIWFIANSGSFGMFILTVFVVWYARKTLHATQKTVEMSEIKLKEARRPEVIAYCDSVINKASNDIYFIIKNIGASPAINVKTNLEVMSGDVSRSILLKAFILNNSIPTFAHDQMLNGYIGNLHTLKDQNGKYPKFKVTLNYEDVDGTSYTESYILDVNMFSMLGYLATKKGLPELVMEVEKIREVIESNQIKS